MSYIVIEDTTDVLDDGRDFSDGLPAGLKLCGHSEAPADVCADLHSHLILLAGGGEDTHTAREAILQGLQQRHTSALTGNSVLRYTSEFWPDKWAKTAQRVLKLDTISNTQSHQHTYLLQC